MLYWWWRTLNCLWCRRFMTDVTHPKYLWLSIAKAQHSALSHWTLPITIFLTLDQTLSQFDAVYNHTAHFCKIHLSVIIHFPFWIFKMATFKEVFFHIKNWEIGTTVSFSLRSANIKKYTVLILPWRSEIEFLVRISVVLFYFFLFSSAILTVPAK